MEFWLVYQAVTLHLPPVVVWAGGVLFWNLVVGPGAAALPPADGRRFLRAFAHQGDRYLTVAGGGAILFGALSGIAIGRYGEALDRYWTGAPDMDRERDTLFARMTRLDRVEMVLFVVILALMGLARFS